MNRLRLVGSVTLALVLAVVSGCQKKSGSGPDGAKDPNRLIIVSPHQKDIKDEFSRGFEKYSKTKLGHEIKIEWLDPGGTNDSLRFVLSEFARTKTGINVDLFWGGGVVPFLTMKREGVLHAFRPADDVLAKIPQVASSVELYDPEGYWYGSAISSFGIIYNKLLLNLRKIPEPKSWEDLGDPRVYNLFSAADPRHSATAQMAYSVILQGYGWEKGWEIITRAMANAKQVTRHASDVPKSVTAGETALGMAVDFYAWAKILEFGADKVGYTLPAGKTVINPDALAILKGAPHMETAIEFVNFVLGEPGQKIWMLKAGEPDGPEKLTLGRLSVIPSLYDKLGDRKVVIINPFTHGNMLVHDFKKGSLLANITSDLIGALFVDSRSDLQRAWLALQEVKEPSRRLALEATLYKMPVSEAEALELGAKYEDKVLRNQKLTEWNKFAVEKYETVGKQAKKS